MTCSNDGSIAVVRCGNWQVEKHWEKPHKGFGVNALAVHPTGKLALSTGGDGVLRTWNLVKGRQAYATNLMPRWKLDAKHVSLLRWSPDGEKYLLAVNNKIDVYSVKIAGIKNEVELESKVSCVEFLEDDLIAVGLEDGKVLFYDLSSDKITLELVAHDTRVKCMAKQDNYLVTASSSGEIKLFNFSKTEMTLLNKVSCDARITCLAIAMPIVTVKANKSEPVVEVVEVKEECSSYEPNFVGRGRVIIEEDTQVSSSKNKLKSKQKRKVDVDNSIDSSTTKVKKLKSEKTKEKRVQVADEEPPVKKKKSKSNPDIVVQKKRSKSSVADENENLPVKKKKKLSNNVSNSLDSQKVAKKVKDQNKSKVKVESHETVVSKDKSSKQKKKFKVKQQ